MKALNFVKRFKKTAAVLSLVLLIFTVSLASGSNWYYTLTIATKILMKTGTYQFFNGTSYLAAGDSAYLSFGGRIADTSAFSTTLATKAIYISGATVNDAYFVAKRNVYGTSTATPTDSCSLSYMAKADSLIVMRQGTYAASGGAMPSGTKFSWIRSKLR